MDTTEQGVSSCRHCQFYKMEGRRGGFCYQLGVLVQGRWRACPFATPLFAVRATADAISIDAISMMSLPEALDLEVLELENRSADSLVSLEE